MSVLLFMWLIWTIYLLCTIFQLKISTSSFCLLLENFSSYIILHLNWCYVSAKCTNTLKDIEQTIASAGGGIALNSELYDGHIFSAVDGSSRRYYGYIDCKANANVLYAGQAVKPSTVCIAVRLPNKQTNKQATATNSMTACFLEHTANANSKNNNDAQWLETAFN